MLIKIIIILTNTTHVNYTNCLKNLFLKFKTSIEATIIIRIVSDYLKTVESELCEL